MEYDYWYRIYRTYCDEVNSYRDEHEAGREPACWSVARRRSCLETCRHSWCGRVRRHTSRRHSDASQWRGLPRVTQARQRDAAHSRTTHGACTARQSRCGISKIDTISMWSLLIRSFPTEKIKLFSVRHQVTPVIKRNGITDSAGTNLQTFSHWQKISFTYT